MTYGPKTMRVADLLGMPPRRAEKLIDVLTEILHPPIVMTTVVTGVPSTICLACSGYPEFKHRCP